MRSYFVSFNGCKNVLLCGAIGFDASLPSTIYRGKLQYINVTGSPSSGRYSDEAECCRNVT